MKQILAPEAKLYHAYCFVYRCVPSATKFTFLRANLRRYARELPLERHVAATRHRGRNSLTPLQKTGATQTPQTLANSKKNSINSMQGHRPAETAGWPPATREILPADIHYNGCRAVDFKQEALARRAARHRPQSLSARQDELLVFREHTTTAAHRRFPRGR